MTIQFSGRLASLNTPAAHATGESDLARRARDLVDGSHARGAVSDATVDAEMKRRRQSGHYAGSNHSALPTRQDELPGTGADGSSMASARAEPAKAKPRSVDEDRAALEARLESESRSSEYIRIALETYDQQQNANSIAGAEKHGKEHAVAHAASLSDYRESQRVDAGDIVADARARRENEDRNAWQQSPSDDDTDTRHDAAPLTAEDARANAAERDRNLWRAKAE
ncbi:MAG: hypothetical protein ABI548_23415 [Polyangiaceae bacterium]